MIVVWTRYSQNFNWEQRLLYPMIEKEWVGEQECNELNRDLGMSVLTSLLYLWSCKRKEHCLLIFLGENLSKSSVKGLYCTLRSKKMDWNFRSIMNKG